MRKTAVIYGSSTGTCEDIAQRIAMKLGLDKSEVIDVATLTEDVVVHHDNLILGTSTWGEGDLQDDWFDGVITLQSCDLTGKTIALFGCGDSESYSDTFCGGMAELWNTVSDKGATLIGQVPTDGYTFDDSASVVDGQFVGLAIDEVNEGDKTDSRIDSWVAEIKEKL